ACSSSSLESFSSLKSGSSYSTGFVQSSQT
ncbi:hypothetical protein X975_09929, partial [Stegodyphus mimosarum]